MSEVKHNRWHLPVTGARDVAFTGVELTRPGVGKWDASLKAFVPVLRDNLNENHRVFRTKANQLIFFCTRPYEDGAGMRTIVRIRHKPNIAALYDFFGENPPVEAFEAIGQSPVLEVE